MEEPSTEQHIADVIDAQALLKRAGVASGMVVADLGCGREGSFTITAAQMVGQSGVVYALDVVKEVLAVVENLAIRAAAKNVVTVWTDLELYGATTRIADGALDVGILANTLFQSDNQEDMLLECMRMVKKEGTLLVVDWKPTVIMMGPKPEDSVDPQEIVHIAESLNYTVTERFDAGEYHWGLIIKK